MLLLDAKDSLLSPATAAARYDVSLPTVYRWLERGLPSMKIGRSRRISESALRDFVQAIGTSGERVA
jgi:excisionase family DNA binding protein